MLFADNCHGLRVFPLHRLCAFCFARLNMVEEFISVPQRMIVLFSGLPRRDSLCWDSMDLESPIVPCIIRFHKVSCAVLIPDRFIKSRHVDHQYLDAIVRPEITNASLIVFPEFKNWIRFSCQVRVPHTNHIHHALS